MEKKIGKEMWKQLYTTQPITPKKPNPIVEHALNKPGAHPSEIYATYDETGKKNNCGNKICPLEVYTLGKTGKTSKATRVVRLTSPIDYNNGKFRYSGAMSNSWDYGSTAKDIVRSQISEKFLKGLITEKEYENINHWDILQKRVEKEPFNYVNQEDAILEIEDLDYNQGDEGSFGAPEIASAQNQAMPEYYKKLHEDQFGSVEGKDFAKQLNTNFWDSHKIDSEVLEEISDDYGGDLIPYNYEEAMQTDYGFSGAQTLKEYKNRIQDVHDSTIPVAARAHAALGLPLKIEVADIPNKEIAFKNTKQVVFSNTGKKYTPQEKARLDEYIKATKKVSGGK